VSHLLLHVFVGEKEKLLAEDCLLTEHVLVVHLLHQARIIDPVCLEELHVCHLERLTDGLCYQLCLHHITVNNISQ